MSRKGENIYKRKDGRWEGRYIKGRLPDGKIRYGYVYAGSYREVRQKVIVLKAGASKESQIDPTESNHMLILSEVAEEWLMSKKAV